MPISKTSLENYRDTAKLAENLYELLERIKARAERSTGAYCATAGSKGTAGDKVGNGVVNIDAIAMRYNEVLDRFVHDQIEVNAAIMELEDPRLLNLMACRYLMGMEWAEVAQRIGYSEQSCYRLHNEALEAMGIKDESP